MKKRLFCALLAGMTVLSLASCNNSGDSNSTPDSSDNGGGINKPAPPEDNEGKEENNGSGDGAGGSSNPAFQVNDGQTDYGGSVFENASNQAQDAISSDDSIPDDLVGIIGDYMDIIKR